MQELQAKIRKLKEIETQLEVMVKMDDMPQRITELRLELEATRLQRLRLELKEIP